MTFDCLNFNELFCPQFNLVRNALNFMKLILSNEYYDQGVILHVMFCVDVIMANSVDADQTTLGFALSNMVLCPILILN